ncbi:Ferredoxin-like protein [Orpheovirus IHUMI-LCC2]|uniref:Ferredoxin-like protein n=1 Tax=Orpheovirus IHUMI-LCC2 TaxID=2023057 RepID=A0A2I2L4Y0_9VIRU|nr:Ferredoxin-like protein [Orpheovirus IHUMI-LCC2]SNW62571.1 Ferredoxin-like protein [Orpheovirus IHUMI-LCC2]
MSENNKHYSFNPTNLAWTLTSIGKIFLKGQRIPNTLISKNRTLPQFNRVQNMKIPLSPNR